MTFEPGSAVTVDGKRGQVICNLAVGKLKFCKAIS